GISTLRQCLLDSGRVFPPDNDVDVFMRPGDLSQPEIHGPTTKQPVIDTSLLQRRGDLLDQLQLGAGSILNACHVISPMIRVEHSSALSLEGALTLNQERSFQEGSGGKGAISNMLQ